MDGASEQRQTPNDIPSGARDVPARGLTALRSADGVPPRSQAAMTVQTAECQALLGED